MSDQDSLPREARVVIVGGGIVGCSIAYHLTLLGWRDVVVLEQSQLAGGTTWHAAGLVGRLRTTNSMTKINKYSAELYASLEQETGHSVGWNQVGSLIVGRSADRMIQLQRTAAMAEWFGVEVQILGAKAAQEKWPLLRIDDVLGAAWLPHDGKVIPQEVARALAIGAQKRGARVFEQTQTLDVLTGAGRARGVRVQRRGREEPPVEIRADYVVLAGGLWTRTLGQRCGVTIPLYPVEHHYVVTEAIPGAYDHLPVGRDPDLCIYFRGEGNGVMLGAFQAHSKPWNVRPIPDPFSFQLLEPDWEKFREPLANGKHRIPALENARFAKFVNGPESFTPDNNFILGEAPELKGLFVAAGFNSVGIASAGGAGKYLAEWMLDGQPGLDLWSVDIRRFAPWANNGAYLRDRSAEVLGLHYQMAWPNREFETGRDVRRTPLHETLSQAGACFGVKNGWERPNWFARPDGNAGATVPQVQYGFGRQNWFANHAAEHRAAREQVALFDQSGFAKLLVHGRDALTALQRLCGNNVDVPIGKAVYTGMFNERGGFESDLTVIRQAADSFYLVTGTAQNIRDADWIRTHVRSGEDVQVVEVTSQTGVLGLMGPRARQVLAQTTDADLSNAAFPFGTAKKIPLGYATVLAVRLTYVGELGWELHVPMEQLLHVYALLQAAGREHGLVNAGHYAINSLRLEKGFRAWGAELSPDDTPWEAGLGFALDLKKEFLGRDALLRQQESGVKRRLGLFVLEDSGPVLWGSEPIYRNDQMVGYTTSGSYGHTVGGAIGMGYVNGAQGLRPEYLQTGRYEILLNGQRQPARIHLRAPYNPDRSQILA